MRRPPVPECLKFQLSVSAAALLFNVEVTSMASSKSGRDPGTYPSGIPAGEPSRHRDIFAEQTKEARMRSIKPLRFVITISTIIAVCGLQLNAQRLDPRAPLGPAGRAAGARRLAGRAAGSTMAAPMAAAACTADRTVQTANGTFITFDVAAAVFGTVPISINPAGEITGFYVDVNFTARPFLRSPDGALTAFDVPNDVTGIVPFAGAPSINPAGAITGSFTDANFTSHGFLRAPDGTFAMFDVPGTGGTGFLEGTMPNSINPAGEITGNFTDLNGGNHGFLRAADGTFSTFDAPGCVGNTFPFTINPGGVIAGICLPNGQGFLREHDGTLTTFNAPGPLNGLLNGAAPLLSINPAGAITGTYLDSNGAAHGFLRGRDGALTTFDAPGAGTGLFQGTFPDGIDPAGEITGVFIDANFADHGFLRAADGTFTTFDAPGAGGTGCGFPGTEPNGINAEGDITGFYSDVNCQVHGFLRKKN